MPREILQGTSGPPPPAHLVPSKWSQAGPSHLKTSLQPPQAGSQLDATGFDQHSLFPGQVETLTPEANNFKASTSDSLQGGDYAHTVYTNHLPSPPTSRLAKHPCAGTEMAISSYHNTAKYLLACYTPLPARPSYPGLMRHSHSPDYVSRFRSDSATTRKVKKSDYYPQ